jgi:hypothetical protein
MAEVSVYVAVISAAAGIAGSALPLATSVVRDGLRGRRERIEREASKRSKACVGLLRTVLDLRVRVANLHDYHGDQMPERRAEIRDCAAKAEVLAIKVSLLGQQAELGETAQRLASAGVRLAAAAAASADLQLGASTTAPDFKELDKLIEAFKSLTLS